MAVILVATQVAVSLLSALSGPLLGLHLLGALVPWGNWIVSTCMFSGEAPWGHRGLVPLLIQNIGEGTVPRSNYGQKTQYSWVANKS